MPDNKPNVNPDNTLPAFNPNFKSEINIESIISAPLIAASKANAEMLKGQTRAIIDNCFKLNTATNSYEPLMINLTLTRNYLTEQEDDKGERTTEFRQTGLTFSVPVICLMPINSLAIDKVNVDFNMEITSVTSWHNEKGVITRQAQLNGKISNNSNSNDTNHYKNKSISSLKVNIHAGQLPLPTGVLAILDLYSKNIQPQQIQLPETDNP